MKIYCIHDDMGNLKDITLNEKTANDLCDYHDTILIHDTNIVRVSFDEEKIIIERKEFL